MAEATHTIAVRVSAAEREWLEGLAKQLTEVNGFPCGITQATRHAIRAAASAVAAYPAELPKPKRVNRARKPKSAA